MDIWTKSPDEKKDGPNIAPIRRYQINPVFYTSIGQLTLYYLYGIVNLVCIIYLGLLTLYSQIYYIYACILYLYGVVNPVCILYLCGIVNLVFYTSMGQLTLYYVHGIVNLVCIIYLCGIVNLVFYTSMRQLTLYYLYGIVNLVCIIYLCGIVNLVFYTSMGQLTLYSIPLWGS